jgi:hypothetical protein
MPCSSAGPWQVTVRAHRSRRGPMAPGVQSSCGTASRGS